MCTIKLKIMGKKKKEEDKLIERVTLLFTREQLQQLNERADREKLPFTTFARLLLLKYINNDLD